MLAERLDKGIKYLRNSGYEVLLGSSVSKTYGYLAGRDHERLNDLQAMFSNPEVKAIFSSRGGYGTPRLLDSLDYDHILKNPKIFMGYSDLTAIHLAIWKHTGLVTFSGPMVAVEMAEGIESITEEFMWPVLCLDNFDGNFPLIQDSPLEVIVPGKSRGTLLGGCLSLVASILGTPHQPDFENAILILEEIAEEPYRIDRNLSQMSSCGILEKLNGIIIGQFLDCNAEEGKPTLTIKEILSDYFGSLSIPVAGNFMYGHGAKKFTIPIGVEVEIDTSIPQISLCESGVEKRKMRS